MGACVIPSCGKDNSKGASGMCSMHTQRIKRHGTAGPAEILRDPNRTAEERVYSRLAEDPDTGCWNWQSSATRAGYGIVGMGQKLVLVHRWVYEHLVGEIPDGLVIDHLCVNRLCANPGHLEPVTRAINNARGGHTTGLRKRRAA